MTATEAVKSGRLRVVGEQMLSKEVVALLPFCGGNSCRGCLESRGLNSHPDTLKMASRIKRLCLKPRSLQSVKIVEKFVSRESTRGAHSYWQVQFKTSRKDLFNASWIKMQNRFHNKNELQLEKKDQFECCVPDWSHFPSQSQQKEKKALFELE